MGASRSPVPGSGRRHGIWRCAHPQSFFLSGPRAGNSQPSSFLAASSFCIYFAALKSNWEGGPPNSIAQLLMKLVGMLGLTLPETCSLRALQRRCVPRHRSSHDLVASYCTPQPSPRTATSTEKWHHRLFLTRCLPCSPSYLKELSIKARLASDLQSSFLC